ncbi:MAG: hypothetical protein QF645_12910, partial [Planctomycetota bacterium]|nr:hypothetical protein [Planctomycetota bacterium]
NRAIDMDPKGPYYAYAARGLSRLRNGDPKSALEDFGKFEQYAHPKDPLRGPVTLWKKEALSNP